MNASQHGGYLTNEAVDVYARIVDVENGAFVLREIAPGVSVDDMRGATVAPLRVPADVGDMRFD